MSARAQGVDRACLDADPLKRFQDAQSLRQAMNAILLAM